MTLLGKNKHTNDTHHTHHNKLGTGAAGPGVHPTAGTGFGAAPLGGSAGMSQTYPNAPELTAQPGPYRSNVHDTYAGPTQRGIPPADVISHDMHGNTTTGTGTGGKNFSGKVESALGTMTGSTALKAKGEQKQHEAHALKMQSRELSEAERLEHEAVMRRERAVGHGAHPTNAILGGGTNSIMGGGAGQANPGPTGAPGALF